MASGKLNILLVKPYSETDEIQPPLGLGYLATAVRDKHNVKILDGIKERLSLEDFREELRERDYDLIGIQCYTFDKASVKEMVKAAKDISQDITIIVGGPEPSSNVDSVYKYLQADFGFKGEAEIGFPMLADYLAGERIDLKDVAGLIWKDNGMVKVNPQKFIENLDDLKHPSWDLLRPEAYPQVPHGAFFEKSPIAPVFATRGCPFSCTFCAGSIISGKRIRHRSIGNFVDEIEMLHREYGIKEVHIEDDNFSFKRQFVFDFCTELIKRKLNISWTCPNGIRLDSIDEQLIELMKKAGLYVISVGIESGSDKILRFMKKGFTISEAEEKIGMLNRAGLDVAGFFILGYPGETIGDINDTINFACRLPLKRVSFMVFKPFYGTEAGEDIIREMENKEINWEDFALNRIVYAPEGITKKQLKRLRQKALIKFYFRPRIMYDFFRSLKSFSHSRYVFKRAFRWMFA